MSASTSFRIASLDRRLDAVAAALPSLLARHPYEEDFWPAFADEVDPIHALAWCASDTRYVDARIESMLGEHGVLRDYAQGLELLETLHD